jgi:hypothetical protein
MEDIKKNRRSMKEIKEDMHKLNKRKPDIECLHINATTKKVIKEIFDLHFNAETKVCNNCGASLRGNDYEEKYNGWLERTYKDNRDKFQIECHIPNDITECIKIYLADYPGTTIATFMKALVVIYFNVLERDEKISLQFESLLEHEILKSHTNNKDKKNVNIQFSPKMMIELIAVAESLDVDPSAIVEEVVIKLTTIFSSRMPSAKEFWANEIHRHLDMLLKAK